MSGPYYGDFKTPSAIAPASDAAASPGAAAGAAAAGPPLTAAQVQSKVEAAVAAVMGDVPAPSQPLVEAGLDSLGALCHVSLVASEIQSDTHPTAPFTLAVRILYLNVKLHNI